MFPHEIQALMGAAVDAIVIIDHQGKMQALNDAASRIFGYRSDELLGENLSMLMPAEYLNTDVPKVNGIGREVRAQRKDGSIFPAWLSVGHIPDSNPPCFVGVVRDTTPEHQAMDELKLERDRANAYLELHDAILLALDSERRVREVNPRGAELLGTPAQTILGSDWLNYMCGDGERERARLLLESALASGSPHERELLALIADDEPRTIYWRCIARRTADGAPAGWLCSGVDMTDRVRREEHAVLAQNRMTQVARLATMGEMAAGVAHELNQPLMAITTYAHACERYIDMPVPDYAELRESVREIAAEGMRAGGIISRLRKLVRSDGQDDRLPTDINSIIEELKVLLSADARVYDTRLNIALTAGLPKVSANPAQLQQLILNLARNAFEAMIDMPSGKRQIQLSTLRNDSGDVEIRVSDTGPGIAPEILERLFYPFATTKKSGTGLGLAISRTIARGHGGNISTRPVLPHGVSFHVSLPAMEDESS
jgi:two-component system sensor kinase FixL